MLVSLAVHPSVQSIIDMLNGTMKCSTSALLQNFWIYPTFYPVRAYSFSWGIKRPEFEAGHSPSSSAEVKECVELYLHYPNKTSCRGAQLKKNFTFTFTVILISNSVVFIIVIDIIIVDITILLLLLLLLLLFNIFYRYYYCTCYYPVLLLLLFETFWVASLVWTVTMDDSFFHISFPRCTDAELKGWKRRGFSRI